VNNIKGLKVVVQITDDVDILFFIPRDRWYIIVRDGNSDHEYWEIGSTTAKILIENKDKCVVEKLRTMKEFAEPM
jgi:hypothetical protein